ncbi:MAG: hypothetical protein IT453_06635 [Planctomycetes bacterium]|nr:hypothetical protein [Planctomycetota bacterium]
MTNTSRWTSLCALAPLSLTASALAGESAVFRSAPGGSGDVIAFDVSAPATAHSVPGLAGVMLLPLDFCGHSAADELAPRFPRQRLDLPNASRLVLQNGHGSLYRFLRAGAAQDTYGFFVVDANGVRVLHELAVPSGAGDPFLPSLAVAFDGATLLVATTLAAGGDLLELQVATGAATVRTAALAPFDFGPHGLALGPQCGFAVHASGILRFSRALGGDATAVTFPAPAPSWFSRELVLSLQGDHAATTAGAAPTQAFVYALGTTGAAVQVSTVPTSLSGAGFLPAADGPHLAISDDGSTVAWRTEGLKREAFMARAQPIGGELPEHLSSDARFLDTLDEIGLYGFRPASNRLVVGIGAGDPAFPNTLDKVDFFTVDLPVGASPAFTNLSLSSGDPTVPFTTAPTLKPTSARWLAAADAFVVHDGNSDQVLVVRAGQTGAQVLLNDAKSLDWMESLPNALLLSVRDSQGNKPQQLWRVDSTIAGPASLVATFQPGNELDRVAVRADGWLAFIETGGPSEFVWRYGSVSGQLQLLTSRPLPYGPSIGFAPAGELVFSIGVPGAQALYGAWPLAGAPKRLPIGPLQPGFVLPGS